MNVEIKIKEDECISCLLLNQMADVPERYFKEFFRVIDLIETVGWAEHTCDWDLFLEFKLNSGQTYETESGYATGRIVNNCFIVDGPDNADDVEDKEYFKNGQWVIPIADVRSVSVHR